MKSQTDDVGWLLEQWINWARVNPGVSLGYPDMTPYRRLLGTTVPSVRISDEQATVIDRAVSSLMQRDLKMGKAVVLYYATGGNASGVAKLMRIDRRKAGVLVKSGTAWIDAALTYSKVA